MQQYGDLNKINLLRKESATMILTADKAVIAKHHTVSKSIAREYGIPDEALVIKDGASLPEGSIYLRNEEAGDLGEVVEDPRGDEGYLLVTHWTSSGWIANGRGDQDLLEFQFEEQEEAYW